MISSQRIKAAQFLTYLARSASKYSTSNHVELKQKLAELEQLHKRLRNSNIDSKKIERLDLKISTLKLKLDKLGSRP